MKTNKIIGISAVALMSLALAAPAEAKHGPGGGRHGGHHYYRHRYHRTLYGDPFFTTYLGFYGAYQPYYYRSRFYRHPRYSDPSLNSAVQRQLSWRGYYRGPINGMIERSARDSIRAFQHAKGMPPSGWIDGKLLRKLHLI